ncbi:hypothetical protein HYPSUDRAFT_198764 [Hypholoma sublateritium FD-334 SS-4]|uniref:Uncharacterized protein n=1 Tax=Hypholoma sublateritium (strain FD-334 SS-4) TaxID=945553 RepID=A0A0D2P6A3_HYPSF|nr:hypothetical protein HYPSUDRAFT_198764 [Hypholoma sublateritium FD-334 SS-4]
MYADDNYAAFFECFAAAHPASPSDSPNEDAFAHPHPEIVRELHQRLTVAQLQQTIVFQQQHIDALVEELRAFQGFNMDMESTTPGNSESEHDIEPDNDELKWAPPPSNAASVSIRETSSTVGAAFAVPSHFGSAAFLPIPALSSLSDMSGAATFFATLPAGVADEAAGNFSPTGGSTFVSAFSPTGSAIVLPTAFSPATYLLTGGLADSSPASGGAAVNLNMPSGAAVSTPGSTGAASAQTPAIQQANGPNPQWIRRDELRRERAIIFTSDNLLANSWADIQAL